MSTSIRDVVQTTLTRSGYGQYMSYAQPVITALEQREQEMAEALVAFAQSQGLNQDTAIDALREVGLTVPSNGDTPSGEQRAELESIRSGLTDLMRRIDSALS